MANAENTYALTSLERVRQHLGPEGSTRSQQQDVELAHLINNVSAAMEKYCGRFFRSRTYTHDGTTLPRLDSCAGTKLWVPNAPITSVTSLKTSPLDTALTEWDGTTGDFVVVAEEGLIELLTTAFYEQRRIVELTYVGGYLDTPAAGQYGYGWDVAAADLQLACIQQVCWVYRGKERVKEGISSRSFEGVTTAYMTDAWLPEVKETLDRYRWETPLR
jgi:hypothetical protein